MGTAPRHRSARNIPAHRRRSPLAPSRLILVLALGLATATVVGCSDDTPTLQAPDPEPEPQPDVIPDAGEDVPEPEPEPQPDVIEPDVEDEPEPEPQPDPEPVPEPDPEPEPEPDPEPEVDPPDCESFALVDNRFFTLPLRTVAVHALGGSGQYEWSGDANNQPDSSVDINTGVYLAGQAAGVVDKVNVTDVACDITLQAEISIIERAEIVPQSPSVPPGQLLCFRIEGGSGDQDARDSPFEWAITRRNDDSSSIMRDGCYLASRTPGVEVIQVTDTNTGQVIQAAVDVTADPMALTVSVETLMVPTGERFGLTVAGGTGLYTFEMAPPNATRSRLEPGQDASRVVVVGGDRSGQGTIVIRDAFLPRLEARVSLGVMAELRHETNAYGSHSDEQDIQGVGDVNGDGIDDVVVTVRNGALNGNYSGLALLYLGVEGDGLASEPSQILPGNRRFNNLGRSVTHGDYNNDGCNDIAVGVFGESLGRGNVGEVRIYTGCNTEPADAPLDWNGRLDDNVGQFEPIQPLRAWRTLPGQNNQDNFGWAVTTGDFNGDGLDDIAASAYRAEASARVDPNDGEPYSDIGRGYVYFNRAETGIPDQPNLFIDGVVIEEDGELGSSDNFRFGTRMAQGDINGDGCDDLLVGSDLADGGHGVASLYMSVQDEDQPSGCVLSVEPALSIVPSAQDRRRTSRLGRDVGMGDFNGDCIPDLVVGQFTAPTEGRGNTSAGALSFYFGDPSWSPDNRLRIDTSTADLIVNGDDNDQLGSGLAVADHDGDGIDDVIVGGRLAEQTGTIGDVGEVRIYRGLIDPSECAGMESPEEPILEESLRLLNDPVGNGDFFGQDVAFIGDVDNDGVQDWAVFASRGPRDPSDPADHLGVVWWLPGDTEEPTFESLRALDLKQVQSDDLFGARVRIVGDINNDGYPDAAVGAPTWDRAWDRGTYTQTLGSAGAVFLFAGGPDGLGDRPDAIIAEHAQHSSSDLLGYSLDAAGDFNGDGIDDLAVGVPFEDANSLCTQCRINNVYRNDIGAALVYFGTDNLFSRRGPLDPLSPVSQPDVVFCGEMTNNNRMTREIAGGGDINGDGFDDLVFANWNFNGARGTVWHGFGRQATEQEVVCLAPEDALGTGDNTSDLVGHGLAMADLDNDGCAEVIAGAYNDDAPGNANAGALHIWPGWGGPGCPTERRRIRFYGTRPGDNIGYRVVVLGDLNGDGVPELAVSSSGFDNVNYGAVLILDGAELGEDISSVVADVDTEIDNGHVVATIRDPEALPNTNFGFGLERAGDLNGDGLPDLMVGARRSNLSGVLRSGAAYLYLGSTDIGELSTADAIFAGHLGQPDAEYATAVAAAAIGDVVVYLVGAPNAEWDGPDFGELGAVYKSVTTR